MLALIFACRTATLLPAENCGDQSEAVALLLLRIPSPRMRQCSPCFRLFCVLSESQPFCRTLRFLCQTSFGGSIGETIQHLFGFRSPNTFQHFE